ncbi:MAG: S26 family signal peptidase, partial [Oscillospiraceae bacterium]|nr:S26 family signal peptidase [Oscillospiraceae bacterium]
MEIVESVIISVFAVLLIFTFVCRPVTVDGTSMVPTLQDKDKLIM